MSLKTTIKRVNLFSQGQRLIVIISSAIAILAMAILYYTPFPIVIFPVVILLNYLLFRRILVTKKMKTIFTKSLKPMIWVLTGFFYFYSVYVISQTPIVIFALCIALTSLIYGLLCYLEIQPEPNIILDNVIKNSETNGSIALNPMGSGWVDIQSNATINGNLIVTGNMNISGNLRHTNDIIVGNK